MEEVVVVTTYSQLTLALDYARRAGARLAIPRFLMDREADKLATKMAVRAGEAR